MKSIPAAPTEALLRSKSHCHLGLWRSFAYTRQRDEQQTLFCIMLLPMPWPMLVVGTRVVVHPFHYLLWLPNKQNPWHWAFKLKARLGHEMLLYRNLLTHKTVKSDLFPVIFEMSLGWICCSFWFKESLWMKDWIPLWALMNGSNFSAACHKWRLIISVHTQISNLKSFST